MKIDNFDAGHAGNNSGPKAKPVLVELSGELSKAGEGRLRQSAKRRKFKLRIFRLIGGWAIVEVHPKQAPEEFDAYILKDLGIRW